MCWNEVLATYKISDNVSERLGASSGPGANAHLFSVSRMRSIC